MNTKPSSDILQILPPQHWTLEDPSCSLLRTPRSSAQTLASLFQSPVSAKKANITIAEYKELLLHIADF